LPDFPLKEDRGKSTVLGISQPKSILRVTKKVSQELLMVADVGLAAKTHFFQDSFS